MFTQSKDERKKVELALESMCFPCSKVSYAYLRSRFNAVLLRPVIITVASVHKVICQKAASPTSHPLAANGFVQS